MSAEVDARIGTRLVGRFFIEERIGAGASAVVYRAVQEPLGRRVALKVLQARDAGDARRFAREAEAMARLRHENVVAVHDVGEQDGTAFIAMELVDGTTLRDALDGGPLPPAEAIDVARGVARALAHAHESGVVHRDLKPQNVMLALGARSAASVRVVDFGLARLTHAALAGASAGAPSVSATIEGTPAYMAPEQVEPGDARPGPASDVYALGVLLYEALTGANPFRAETALKTLARHVDGPVPLPPSTHAALGPAAGALDALVTQMLQKDPPARPTAAAVAAALDGLAEREAPSEARDAARSAAHVEAGERPRGGARAVLAAAAAVAVVAAVAVGALGGGPAPSRPPDAGAMGRAPAVSARAPSDGRTASATQPVIDAGTAAPVVAPSDAPIGALADAPTAGHADAHADRGEVPRDERAPAAVGRRHVARVDAGDAARSDAGPAVDARAAAQAGAQADAGEPLDAPQAPAAPSAALEQKVRALAACADPCAVDVSARFDAAVAGDLATLKAFRGELEACRARCAR